MKLRYLQVSQFRQFRAPFRLDGLGDGINLVVGPNESGKSTLAEALRAAFFERYKSRSVDYLQPWGDSSATPEIELAFDWQDERWVLHKRFLKAERCDLEIGSRRLSGGEAEDALAELFGYSFAGRGASKAEHHGIPGLLWVEQGATQDIQTPVASAESYLNTALGKHLGGVTSTQGDDLIERLAAERAKWLTGTGRPTGDFKRVIDELATKQAEIDPLTTCIDEYRTQVDELGRLRGLRQTIDATRPWETQREAAKAADAELAKVRALQTDQEADQKALVACADGQNLYRQQLEDFEAKAKQLRAREKARNKAQEAVDAARACTPQLEAQLTAAQEAFQSADAANRAARTQAHRQRVQREHDQLATALAADQKTLREAQNLQAQLQPLRASQQAVHIDPAAFAKLQKLQRELDNLDIRRAAVASKLQYQLADGQQLTLGSEQITGAGERLLLEPTELVIPEVGTLRILPGGSDIAELGRQQRQAAERRDELLHQLGIESLEQGLARQAEDQHLTQNIATMRARLDAFVPKGVEVLAERCGLDQSKLAALSKQLEALPPPVESVLDEAVAEAALEAAQAALKAAEQAGQEHRSALGIAEYTLATATDECTALQGELESPEHKERVQAANAGLIDLKAQQSQLKQDIAVRQQRIDAAQPDVLAQDVERYTKSADAMEAEARQREIAIGKLQVQLQTLGAQGLEEQRATLQQEIAGLQRRHDELQQRTQALDLLLGLLRDKRQELTRQLQAPLQKHLDHYVGLLFPQASLSVDDRLVPTFLTRGDGSHAQRGALEALSFGAREQMGLVSRLAYADLLREAGKPTLIILDDALVHTDDDRLKHMKRILFDAATRHQILLFSCHPERWRDLGAAPRDLQSMKATAA